MNESPSKISLDEALSIVSEIARNGTGPDQFRALKMVMAQEAGTATLPEPLSDAEVIERGARLIRAMGPTAAQLAYRKAFPQSQRPINHAAPKIAEGDIAPIDKSALPINLRSLYRMFPEIKKAGVPKGFPINRGLAVQKEWCQKMAMKMILDREQQKADMIATAAAPEKPDDA